MEVRKIVNMSSRSGAIFIMEEGNASEVTYDTIFMVSTSGFLAKQTLEEGKWTSKVAAGIIRPQLI